MASPVLANSSSQLNGKTLVTTVDNQTITGSWTFDRAPNAPFAVLSGAANVPNLDADKLDGNHVADILAQAPTMPSGSMAMFCGSSSSIPAGWLWCNGAAVSRATYAALFSAIGTSFGAGDGVSTFNLPNMQQAFPLGVAASGTGSTLGGAGGSIDHTHTYNQVINHTHSVTVTDPGHDHTVNGIPTNTNTTPGPSTNSFVAPGNTVTVGSNTTGISATTANPGGGVATGTTALANPPYIAMHFMIKQ